MAGCSVLVSRHDRRDLKRKRVVKGEIYVLAKKTAKKRGIRMEPRPV